MKILRVIGLILAIFFIKFLLMRGVFGAFEGALISLFTTFETLMKNISAASFPAI